MKYLRVFVLLAKTAVVLIDWLGVFCRTKVARLVAQCKQQTLRVQAQADEIVRLRSCLTAQARFHTIH
jgi:hypothetical protein